MDGLGEDRAPFALTRFDARSFADEIHQRFGDGDPAPFIIDVCDFTGQRANWIIVSAAGSTLEEVDELVLMCNNRGLHVYAT
jgi:hypothetical protein